MKLEIDMPEHHYNNIIAFDSVSLGRVPYKGIIMYAINAIKRGKALEQEPTTKNDLGVDCISRFEVTEILNSEYDIDKMLDRVDELPSVTPQEPRWIPVSEKLPEPYMFVNATCRSLIDNRDNWVVETIYLPIPKEHNPRHYSDWGNIPMLNWGEAEVIAWMKRIIPEPYKMVEEQESEET